MEELHLLAQAAQLRQRGLRTGALNLQDPVDAGPQPVELAPEPVHALGQRRDLLPRLRQRVDRPLPEGLDRAFELGELAAEPLDPRVELRAQRLDPLVKLRELGA